MTARCGSRWCARLVVVGMLGMLLASTGALASSSPTPWDGRNPYLCKIQNAGKGTKVPDPGADPYCVNFDKTNQNVTQLGLVKFLSLEPARTESAGPKCFYYQQDHWRGSVIQSDAQTKTYEFHGHYFFNKATGDGGVWVTDFNINGRTFDPASLPGFPPQYGKDFGPGTGGFITHNAVPVDPACVAKARAHRAEIYSSTAHAPRCVAATGPIGRRRLGPVRLGQSEQSVRSALGPPKAVKRGFLHYCARRGGALLIGEPGDRSGTLGSGGRARVVILLTTSRQFGLTGWHGKLVRVGSSARARGGRTSPWRVLLRTRHGIWVRYRNLLAFVIPRGRIRYLGLYSRHALPRRKTLIGYLERAR
jgi:hypothetical protein